MIVTGFLLFFGVMTVCSWDGMTTFYVAMFTLGVCGLPSTLVGVVIWGYAGKLFHVPEATSYWVSVVVIAACFVGQWLYWAAKARQADDK
jgi:hypothetical protein